MFNRAGVYYSEDTTTGKQHSLRTKNEAEALALLHSKNEAYRQPVLNLHIARTYPNSLGTNTFANSYAGDVTNKVDGRGFATAYQYIPV